MKPGDIYVLDFPGHALHGRGVEIVSIEPTLNLAPPDGERWPAEVVFIKHPNLPEPVGVGRERLAGSAENVSLRALLRDDGDDGQGELLL